MQFNSSSLNAFFAVTKPLSEGEVIKKALCLHVLLCYASIALVGVCNLTSAVTQSVSDLIRNHVAEIYLKTAIRRGEDTFTVNVGAVHKALKLANRVPQVCSALESKKLLEENQLRIVSKTGPPSGQSTTVIFTYQILSRDAKPTALANPLIMLRGLAKDLFKELGGGEDFIRRERSSFTNK
ncbi:MAG: hypothetical protein WA738_10450 [Candidatus Angelobacter sp.]